MSAPVKKRAFHVEKNNSDSDNSSCSSNVCSSEDDESPFEFLKPREIQVDFEGRNPIDSDFHGIKLLLQQLFLKAHVNLSELTDFIISQNYVGSVVKQSDEDDDSDDEADDSSSSSVFGITTVVNLTDKKNLECVQQLRELLTELSNEHGTDQSKAMVDNLLSNDKQAVGLLINERFVNIPAQISVPLLQGLSKEMHNAREKKYPFEFGYFIIICKLYKMDGQVKDRKSRKAEEPMLIWSNPEEELFDQNADCSFEFCVKDSSDSGMGGNWVKSGEAMTPYRRILIISSDKMELLIQRVEQFIA